MEGVSDAETVADSTTGSLDPAPPHERVPSHPPGRAFELTELLRHSTDVLVVIDNHGVITYASPAIEHVLGYTPSGSVGRHLGEFAHPDDIERATLELDRVRQGLSVGEPFDVRILDATGAVRMFEVVASNRLDEPSISGFIIHGRDVSDWIGAREALRDSEYRYRQIVETADEGVWTIDADNRTSFVNRRMAEMLGYSVDEMIGMLLFDFMDDEGRVIAEANVERRRQGISEHHDFKFMRRDDTELWAMLSTSPLLDEQGAYLGALALVTDVTERRETEANLRDLARLRERTQAEADRRQLEAELARAQRLESVGRLAGGVAHDFNNLIGVILNYAKHAQVRVAPDDELADDVAHIMTAATQAADLANRLLVFASDDCGQEPTEFPLNDLVRDTVDLMSRPIGEGIAVATDLGPDSMRVLADRGQLAQVLVNLLLNARDAVGESGAISVATGNDTDHVELNVVDTGRGMTDDVVRRAFDPFFTTKPLSVGTGLGLSTAHTVVTRLGGTIQLESAPGHGTTVRIRLPLVT